MTKQAQIFYAKKFFPHLLLSYGVLAVQDSLRRHGIAFEQVNL